MKFNFIQSSFANGEISPRLSGRVELEKYSQSAKRMQNQIALVGGGTMPRPGSILDRTTTAPVHLLPFSFSLDDSRVLFLGNDLGGGNYLPQIWDPSTKTTLDTDPFDVTIASIVGMEDTHFAQSGDVVYLANRNTYPHRVYRSGGQWIAESIGYFLAYNQVPYRTANLDTGLTIAIAGSITAGNTVTLTAAEDYFDEDMEALSSGLGTYLEINNGYLEITNVTSPTSATALVKATLSSSATTSNFRESAWSRYRGYPRTVCFYQDRLIWGGNESQPDTLWFSENGDYTNLFNPTSGATNTSPFNRTLNSQQVNAIEWMCAKGVLNLGTTGAEFTVKPADPNTGFGPSNITSDEQTAHGSRLIQPAKVSHATLFVTRQGRKVREYLFEFDSDSFVADDLSIAADHLPGFNSDGPSAIKQIAWQEDLQLLWCIDEDGSLFAMTRDRKSNTASWHRHVLGGTLTGADAPKVHSICVIPHPDGYDALYMSVERTINATTVYTMEHLAPPFELDALDSDAIEETNAPYLLDCATYKENGTPANTFTGLIAYASQAVGVLADGFYYTGTVSAGGVFTLPSGVTASYGVIGFTYEQILIPTKINIQSRIGSGHGLIKRIDQLDIEFYNTTYCKVGPSLSNLKEVTFRDNSLASEDPTPLYTGEKKIDHMGGYDRNQEIVIYSDKPFPLSILSYTARGIVNEG